MSITCPVCESGTLETFFSIKKVPVIINILSNSRQEAVDRPTGDIELGFCHHCGHIYNAAFDPALLDYSGEYDNSLHFSATFREFARGLADSMVIDRGWVNVDLLEVGCGKADFLKLLCDLGGNQGIGFDPSIQSQDWQPVGNLGGKLKLVRGYFGKDGLDVPGDRIICQHVLEHVEAPLQFIRDIVTSRSGYSSHSVYFEVPNVYYILRDFSIWDIIYEHCSYFSPESLRYLFNRCGYKIDLCEEKYGRQFLSLFASHPGNEGKATPGSVSPLAEMVGNFTRVFEDKTNSWKRSLAPARAGDAKVVVWGAGAKGVTFLNMMTDGKGIDFIIDQNPAKIGKYVAGTGQRIENPAFLAAYQPDQVIIMNPLYKDEIAHQLGEMGLNPEILVV